MKFIRFDFYFIHFYLHFKFCNFFPSRSFSLLSSFSFFTISRTSYWPLQYINHTMIDIYCDSDTAVPLVVAINNDFFLFFIFHFAYLQIYSLNFFLFITFILIAVFISISIIMIDIKYTIVII
jgi:hypothetical protein